MRIDNEANGMSVVKSAQSRVVFLRQQVEAIDKMRPTQNLKVTNDAAENQGLGASALRQSVFGSHAGYL